MSKNEKITRDIRKKVIGEYKVIMDTGRYAGIEVQYVKNTFSQRHSAPAKIIVLKACNEEMLLDFIDNIFHCKNIEEAKRLQKKCTLSLMVISPAKSDFIPKAGDIVDIDIFLHRDNIRVSHIRPHAQKAMSVHEYDEMRAKEMEQVDVEPVEIKEEVTTD